MENKELEMLILNQKGISTEDAEVIFYPWGGFDIMYK